MKVRLHLTKPSLPSLPMIKWHDLFEALDTPSGHIIILSGFFVFSVFLWKIGYPNWEQLEGPILGALLMRLTGMRTLQEKKNADETTSETNKAKTEERLSQTESNTRII